MSKKPNVVLVLTDDQGYGDLGCTGNPYIQTPHIDQFYKDGTHLDDFHVSPLCAPTRGALMTGCRPLRNGVWATCWGRSILSRESYTLGNLFEDNGYTTGLFGKWHLGDNYPYRPQDRGFQKVVAHKGGGVGQTPDFWGNNYFDDTYFNNGEATQYIGYCTDVWFECTKKFIKENKDQPFFAIVATNAPHSPYLVEERYAEKYRNNPDIPHPEFYGMIENIDENFGSLRTFLQEEGLEDDTILIFMTDNGTSGGLHCDKEGNLTAGYNGGMRGMKGSHYDGGHRVPFIIRYPNGNIVSKSVDEMIMHTDMLPTFASLCDLAMPTDKEFDGINVCDTIVNGTPLEDRIEFVQFKQGTFIPDKWVNAVLTKDYRLINGTELYAIKKDPNQRNDIASEHPEIVAKLREAHENWWESVVDVMLPYNPILIGSEHENPTRLDAMDVLGDVAWSQSEVHAAKKSAGEWAIAFDAVGTYTFTLCRWPSEIWDQIIDELPREEVKTPAPYHAYNPTKVAIKTAKLTLGENTYEAEVVDGRASFTVEVDDLSIERLHAGFYLADGDYIGAFYVYVERTLS
ncbi:MAG: arylsulfatase [Lachnospiraceae bacterium]